MADWRANLRRAAFRGVEFHTADRDFESGRRIENHEFPKRNSNFPEDMGKATREFSVDAYVVGDDYMARRNRLIKVCEQEGPGQYVDHWGLSQRVVCRKVRVIETSQEGRFCKLRLDFIEAGGGAAPFALPATAPLLTEAAGGLVSAVMGMFADRTLR
jgi:prophage DNA circulation protein